MATINLYQSYNFLTGNPANNSWTQQKAPGLIGYSTGMTSTDGMSTESWEGIFQFPVHPELGGIQLAGGLIKTLQISKNGNQLLSGSDLTLDAFTRYKNLNAGEGGKLGTWLNFDDTINGSSSNDVIMAYGGNDTIDGGGGIDTVVYAGSLKEFSTWLNGSTRTNRDNSSENGSEGTDTLRNIERLQFSDAKIALDIDGNAGKVAKILATVFGASAISNKEYTGIGLSLMDGGMSYETLAALAIRAAGAHSREAVVDLLWTNLTGSKPSAEQAKPFVDFLSPDLGNVGTFGAIAADYAATIGVVNLNSLGLTGFEYA